MLDAAQLADLQARYSWTSCLVNNSGSPSKPPELVAHDVAIASFAVGRFEVTRAEFSAFVRATSRDMSGSCLVWRKPDWTGREWGLDPRRNWRDPSFHQDDRHPVVCVTFDDAKAYVAWLAARTGRMYRLLSEAEWEYAARSGSTGARPWRELLQACEFANVSDLIAKGTYGRNTFPCRDGYAETSPVGSFKPNGFGLHDMLGNVEELVEDCWNRTYDGAPADGSAWGAGDCRVRVVRGGSWASYLIREVTFPSRSSRGQTSRSFSLGFRVARGLS